MKQFHNIKLYAATLLMLTVMGACTDEERGNTPLIPAEENITFLGSVKETKKISTRSDNYIIINGQNDGYGEMDFYIYQKIDDNSPTIQIYQPSGGEQGRLETKEEQNPLKWESTTASHLFYAWTQPNVTNEESQEVAVTGGVKMDSPTEKTYPTTGTVIFGTEEKTKLEHFIVTKQGPLTYDENNQYVGLHFYHPVGKIVIDNIRHFRADGSSEPVEKCTITFPNLYANAKFTVTNAATPPYSDIYTEATETGVEWKWRVNEAQTHLYVKPFTFASEEETPYYEQPGYFIVNAEVTIGGKPTNRSYTGTLVDSSPTITELKGNEELHISMQVADGNVTGINSHIVDWNDDDEITVPQHRVPGIYTQADAQALLNALQNGTEIPDYLVDTDEENNKIIRFFTHVDWSKLTENVTIPEGYILDGQGYNLILPDGVTLYGIKEEDESTGNIRNLYVNGAQYEFQQEAPTPEKGEEETTESGNDEENTSDNGNGTSTTVPSDGN